MTGQERLNAAEPRVFDALCVVCCDDDATVTQRNQAFKRLMSMYGMSESLKILQQFIINGYRA